MTRLINTKDLSVVIPQPIITLGRDDLNFNTVIKVNWLSTNTSFLDYKPKYYLFRYYGKRRKISNGVNKPAKRGYVHPVHLNGIDEPQGQGWWSGGSYNIAGELLNPRETEWPVPSSPPNQKLILPLDKHDWVYTKVPTPCAITEFRVRGSSGSSARNAYFYVAIGISLKNRRYSLDKETCPIIFGPSSTIFSLIPRPVSFETFDGWEWNIRD